jgi:hypothetical protein
MPRKSGEKFWLENPSELITNFCKFNPFKKLNHANFPKNMNAYTRLIIIVVIVIYCITKEIISIFIGLFLIVIIIIMYYSFKKDSFEVIPSNFPFMTNNHETIKQKASNLLKQEELPERQSDYYNTETSENNPLKNVPITDYGVKQEYSKASRSDSGMSKFVNSKMFQTSEQWIFDKNTRQYYTTPNTQVPNDRTAFANWLYGTENNCKEGSIYMHRTGTPEQATSCNGFNISTPTNFGNLNDYVAPSNE